VVFVELVAPMKELHERQIPPRFSRYKE